MSVLDRVRPKYSTDEQVERGMAAGRMLRDDIFREAVEETELLWIGNWLDATATDERDRCWAVIHALGELERTLRSIESDGEVAQALLQRA
jgi:hypothetical protein